MVGVPAVAPVGEQVLVFGIGHKQQSEQNDHHLLVGVVEVGLTRIALAPALRQAGGYRPRQHGHGLVVNPIPQPLGQSGGVVSGVVEDLVQRTPGDQGFGREQERQVAGLVA